MRGLRNAVSCVGACWAMMAPMLLAGHVAAMWLMGPVTLAIAIEKFAAKPKKVIRPVAAGLATLAILTTIW
jgi:predicted metal-binding membrane protein